MFSELYQSVETRFGAGSSTDSMGDWICTNTTIKKRPFSFEQYQFQKAIADDMHLDMSVKKCSQIGLALDVRTPVATPSGWTTMGDVQVGEQVFDEQGQPCTVTYTSPIYTDHACYEVEFDDGEIIVADAGHRWAVQTTRGPFNETGVYQGKGRPNKSLGYSSKGVVTTQFLMDHQDKAKFFIPNTQPLSLAEADLLIHPYVLGLWLGDGNAHSSTLTLHDSDFENIRNNLMPLFISMLEGHRRGTTGQYTLHDKDGSLYSKLNLLGVLKNKHIPTQYLRASPEQRLQLLQGLMDTDGSITKKGRASFYNNSKEIVAGAMELVRSLGHKPRVRWRRNAPSTMKNGHQITPRHDVADVSFVPDAGERCFGLERKDCRQLSKGFRPRFTKNRTITKVSPVETCPVRCIQVDSLNHLFLAGKGMVPTHNTEVQIRKFLGMLTRGNSLNGIFTLPNEKMFTRIYNGRIKPILESDQVFNPVTALAPVRRRDQIQIRDSFGYITGCTEGDATSTSADFLMHDEVDLSPQETLALYQSRLQNSDLQMTQKFSTPTFVGFGIDKSYALGDQREYIQRCTSCNHYQIPRFTPRFIHFDSFPFEVESYMDLTIDQINMLDLEAVYVKCEQCDARLDLGNPDLREWVATYPTRNNFRGYQVRPFSTSRLKPRYLFTQLAKYLDEGFPRGFANTVLGEAYTEKNAQIQRDDVLKCMTSGNIPNISAATPVFLGVDVGFTCHITLSIDDENGLPAFVLFDTCPAAQLESKIQDLRKIYTIVQGAADRFPFTPTVDALRDITQGLVIPVQYRGSAALQPQRDELGNTTHYSANRTLLLDRIHTLINNHKMVLSGYTGQKETLITHLCDMVRDEQPDVEAVWKKITGADHYFHAMALSLLARRICDHMYHHQSPAVATTSVIVGATGKLPEDLNGMNLSGIRKISRLG